MGAALVLFCVGLYLASWIYEWVRGWETPDGIQFFNRIGWAVVFVVVFVVAGFEETETESKACHDLGGQYIQVYRSTDLCYGPDGRLLRAF
jgi:hypothetical protein